jgi:hypothetical protein
MHATNDETTMCQAADTLKPRSRHDRWRRPARFRRLAVVLAPFVILLLVGACMPLVMSAAVTASRQSAPSVANVTGSWPTTSSGLKPADETSFQVCDIATLLPVPMVALGPGCNYMTANTQWSSGLSEYVLTTALYNYLNITAAGVANLNASAQELLSYFEDRAQAIVPGFLNQTWTPQLYDEIAIDSGLVPAIEGMELAFGEQQFQLWNATFVSWNHDISIGPDPPFQMNGWSFPTNQSGGPVTPHTSGNINDTVLRVIGNTEVSRPWEFWTTHPANGAGQSSFYFNLMPGGTIINANITNGTAPTGAFTVTDVTQGFAFPVPAVSAAVWNEQPTNTSIPVVTNLYHINQFDLLKLTCNSGCNIGTLEVSGGFAFMNPSALPPTAHFVSTAYGDSWDNNNTMVYALEIFGANNSLFPGTIEAYYPTVNAGWCATNYVGTNDAGCVNSGTSTFATVPSEGSAQAMSHGPGQANPTNALTGYASTMKNLVNNTMTMAYDYYVMLRALTDKGAYVIPADCAIPTPSQAFPSATNFANYQLNSADVFAVYLSYLNAVARAYGSTFTNGFYVCGDNNLAVSFNWTYLWQPLLNITASIYLGGPTGPVTANGTNDTHANLSNPATWPIKDVQPTLLYPFDYQMNIPIGSVYAIPINDPAAALLINSTLNTYYGDTNLSQGVPTYLSLNGYGDYVDVSGFLTAIPPPTGSVRADGDAIYISACTLGNVAENGTCDVSVTYYNNFTYGIVHAIFLPNYGCPSCTGPGGNPLGNTNDCGFGNLHAWYDSWIGYIGSSISGAFSNVANDAAGIPLIGGGLSYFIKGTGCILAWIIVILIVLLVAYIIFRIIMAIWHAARGT